MKKLVLCAAILTGGFLLASAHQERVKPKGPADFDKLVAKATAAWKGGSYGECVGALNACLQLAIGKRSDAIFAALPSAPENWSSPEPKKAAEAGNPFLSAMAGAIGNIVERKYRQADGRGTIDVTVTADSPLVSMLGMVMSNPAMDPTAEAIKYGEHKALLKKEGGRLELQILIADKHVVEVRTNQDDEELLFALFDQKAIDRIAAALGN